MLAVRINRKLPKRSGPFLCRLGADALGRNSMTVFRVGLRRMSAIAQVVGKEFVASEKASVSSEN
jgi:hypothetical protein